MLRRLGIRGKVLAALAVPVVVLFGAASVISAQSMESSNVARAVNELVSTADELVALTSATLRVAIASSGPHATAVTASPPMPAEYTAMIKLHVETARVIADVLPDRALAKYIDAYGLVGEAREKVVRELPTAVQIISTGGSDARAVVNLAPSVAVTTALDVL